MEHSILFGISLTASFFAGILALFAPCCITFLFPSYLGTIFKENKKVMFYTFVFAIGLSFVLIPIALGFRFAVFFLDAYHKQVYYFGAMVLILMGITTLKPIFHLPQLFNTKPQLGRKVTTGSVFGLGLMSGLTSSCCAPVLFAAITLTSLSPSLIQAVFVSGAYVMGIVFPLFLLSLAYEKTSQRVKGENRQKLYNVFRHVGAGVFTISGLTLGIFNYLGKIEMEQMEGYSSQMRNIVFDIAKIFQNPVIDIATFMLVIFVFYQLLKRRHPKNHEPETECN